MELSSDSLRGCGKFKDSELHLECAKDDDASVALKTIKNAETSFKTVQAALEAAKEALRAAREARARARNNAIEDYTTVQGADASLRAIGNECIDHDCFWVSQCYKSIEFNPEETLTFVNLPYNIIPTDELGAVGTNLDAKLRSTPVENPAECLIETNGDIIDPDVFGEIITFLESCSWDIGEGLCEGDESGERLVAMEE